ncbi:hypothetical protein [Microcoleus sp.]|uniref:hypothetical protein n=1 Tax=Microcoleus sp. TaxID=44472 RepID=UPI00403E6E01
MPSTWQGNYLSIYTHCKTGMLPMSLPYSDTWYMVADGYQTLPKTLATEFERGWGSLLKSSLKDLRSHL